jgi:hypothetical protein
MSKWNSAVAASLAAGVLAVGAIAGTIVSGVQPGEHMTQFDVFDVSGPARGQTLCYV